MTRRVSPTIALLAALLATNAAPVWAARPADRGALTEPTPLDKLGADIEQYTQHVNTLANPFFEGRVPGSRGNALAADYLEWHYRQLGLKPAFPATKDIGSAQVEEKFGSYRQSFEAPPTGRPGDRVRLQQEEASWDVGGKRNVLDAGREFKATGFSGSGAASGQVVFAGYSINNPEKEYVTFPEGTDLTGKIVLLFRFEPMDEQGRSKWADVRWSVAASLAPKFRLAAERGAAGIILVNPPGADDERTTQLQGLDLASPRPLSIPVVMLSQDAADTLARAAGTDLMGLRREADTGPVLRELPGVQASLDVNLEKIVHSTDNVGAILPGKGDLAGEYIVIGSHYDHVGYGFFGSRGGEGKIHPGADDNASGTSGNLLVARRLAEMYKALPEDANARSVLFLQFSAEESGLVGSRHYVNHPIAPMEKHALMINMDMIGRLRDGRLEVGGVGTADGLEEWVDPYLDSSGMTIKTSKVGASNSDHFSFYSKNVPNLFFFTGLHREYHTSDDTADTINVEGGAQVADLVARMAFDAALRPEPFTFVSGNRADRDNPGPVGGVSVRFGIAPGDYSGEKPGVLVGDVFENLPAAKAGLKAGDLMTKWNGQDIVDVETWMGMLGEHKPGDKVTIEYIRDGQTLTTEAELVARGRPQAQ